MPTIGTESKPGYIYDADTDTWIPIGVGAHTHSDATLKSTLTTTGDIYYASAASTPARLGIGSSGQVLTVSGGIPAWAAAAGFGTLTSFTPTLSGITIGNGTFKDVGYSQSGDAVWYQGIFTVGSTTSFTGVVKISLPVNGMGTNMSVNGRQLALNMAAISQPTTGYIWPIQCVLENASPATRMNLFMLLTNGTYLQSQVQEVQNTVPITFASGDSFAWNILYQKA